MSFSRFPRDIRRFWTVTSLRCSLVSAPQALFHGEDGFAVSRRLVRRFSGFFEDMGDVFPISLPGSGLGFFFQFILRKGRRHRQDTRHITQARRQAVDGVAYEDIRPGLGTDSLQGRRQFRQGLGFFNGTGQFLQMGAGRGVALFIVDGAGVEVGDFLFRRPLGISSLLGGDRFQFLAQWLLFLKTVQKPGPRSFLSAGFAELLTSCH